MFLLSLFEFFVFIYLLCLCIWLKFYCQGELKLFSHATPPYHRQLTPPIDNMDPDHKYSPHKKRNIYITETVSLVLTKTIIWNMLISIKQKKRIRKKWRSVCLCGRLIRKWKLILSKKHFGSICIYIRIYLLGGGECWRGRYLFSDKTIFKHFFSQNTYDTCI